MKRKVIFIGAVILIFYGFMFVQDNRDPDIVKAYNRGYVHGYKARQKDLQWQVEAWQKRYYHMIDREVERWRNE